MLAERSTASAIIERSGSALARWLGRSGRAPVSRLSISNRRRAKFEITGAATTVHTVSGGRGCAGQAQNSKMTAQGSKARDIRPRRCPAPFWVVLNGSWVGRSEDQLRDTNTQFSVTACSRSHAPEGLRTWPAASPRPDALSHSQARPLSPHIARTLLPTACAAHDRATEARTQASRTLLSGLRLLLP